MKRAGAWVEVWGRGVRAGGKEEGSGGLRSSPFIYTSVRRVPHRGGGRWVAGCALFGVRGATTRAPNRGDIRRICAPVHVFLGGGYETLNKHPPSSHAPGVQTRTHTHTVTPHTDFLFSVSVYAWLLSKQSKHMSHFRDRWFKPKATCSLSLWQW